MICSLINIININIFCLVNKLGMFVIYLLSLNKLNINLQIVLLIVLLMTSYNYFKVYLLATYILVIFSLNKYTDFINNFTYGYFKIHPTLFYLALSMYMWNLKKNNFLKFTKLFITIATTISIILGSLWALYQLSWGYYWSNDPIELALVFVLLLFVIQIHTTRLYNYYIHLFFFFVILYIHLIRMGFIYTKHNFFSLLGIFLSFLLFFLYWFYYIMLNNIYIQIKLKITKNYISWLFLCLFSILFINYSYNFYMQKLLKVIIKYSLIFLICHIIWKNVHQKVIHLTYIIILLFFNLYIIQYLVFIKLSTIPNELITQNNKKKIVHASNLILKYFRLNYQRTMSNLFSLFKYQINTKFFLQKNLINFF